MLRTGVSFTGNDPSDAIKQVEKNMPTQAFICLENMTKINKRRITTNLLGPVSRELFRTSIEGII